MTTQSGHSPLDPGLYLVATPIGNARDITLRAIDTLSAADVLVAEDTRTLRRLMEIHGIALSGRRLISYHDHNGETKRPRILEMIEEGHSVAYCSDAGMPLVADPGFALARDVGRAGLTVTSVPGASAPLTALSLSGLPSDAFDFVGFSPTGAVARKKFLQNYATLPATLILFESSRRLFDLLVAAVEVFGADREAAVCRELTKKFEEIVRGDLGGLVERYSDVPPKGEIVVCIAKGQRATNMEEVEAALTAALQNKKLKEAAAEVSAKFDIAKRDVYQLGLKLRGET